MTIIAKEDLLEAKCRYCGKWCSNEPARDAHEGKNHIPDDDKKYDDKFRDENGKVYTADQIAEFKKEGSHGF